MKRFRYRAAAPDGQIIRGTISAHNRSELSFRLRQLNLQIVEAKDAKLSGLGGYFGMGRVSVAERHQFFTLLHHLYAAGVPVSDALRDVGESLEGLSVKEVILEMRSALLEGESLSGAMSAFPTIFSDTVIAMIAAGEEGGDLENALAQAAEYLGWQKTMRSSFDALIRGPLIMLFLSFLAILALTLFMLPELVASLENAGRDVPPATKSLYAFSQFLNTLNFEAIVLGTLAAAAIIYVVQKSISVSILFDRFAYRLPWLGVFFKKAGWLRFAKTFGPLYASGVPVRRALAITRQGMNSPAFRRLLLDVDIAVKGGASLSQALSESPLSLPMVRRFIRIGEGSGDMDSNLKQLSLIYGQEMDHMLKKIMGIIEPFTGLVLAIIVIWIAMAVLIPVYSVAGGF